MQTIDVVIFTVVITLVTLAMAQTVIFKLSSDSTQVHVIHKIIGRLGLGAAGFALFLSVFVLGENKGVLLILIVLAIAAIGSFLQKLKKRGEPKPENPPVPDDQISSHEPDATLAWCANCQTHTYPGKRTVTPTDEYGNVTSTYQVECCGHCQSHMLWNVPSTIRKTTYGCCGCATVPALIMLACLIWGWLYGSQNGFALAAIMAVLLLPIMGFVTWFVYLHTRWRSWVKRQRTQSTSQTG